jgi:hypothetical protein
LGLHESGEISIVVPGHIAVAPADQFIVVGSLAHDLIAPGCKFVSLGGKFLNHGCRWLLEETG